jgi:hypothetical protein
MLFLWSVNLRDGADKEFQEWVKKNKESLTRYLPPRWRLWGIYGATFGLGPRDVTVIYEFDKWADLDAMREYSNEVADRMDAEFYSFALPGSSRGVVLRDVAEWVVTEPKKPKK